MRDAITNKNKTFTLPIVLILICGVIGFIVFLSHPFHIEKSDKVIQTSKFAIEQIPNTENLSNIIENLQQKNKQIDKFVIDTKSELNDLKEKIDNITRILMSVREPDEQFLPETIELDPMAKAEAVEEQAEAQSVTELQTLEDLLNSEKVDEDWSNSINVVIDKALSRPEMQGMELVDKHCGSTLCRLEFTFDKTTVDLESIDEMLSLTGDRGEGFASINEEKSNAILYFAKEDYSLF